MCLVAFAWKAHPRFQLVLAGNRDEFHARPTAPLARWTGGDAHLLAGRDLEAGGTWLGVSERGRACVVTNVRDPLASKDGRSRGMLALEWLRGELPAGEHAKRLAERAGEYRPFNFLLFDRGAAWHVGTHPRPAATPLMPGVHALSNGRLGEEWPKTRRLRAALVAWLERGDAAPSDLFTSLADETPAPDADLPETGVGLELERFLSPPFIHGPRYGTRASTVLTVAAEGGGEVIERSFGSEGVRLGEVHLRFEARP